MEALGTQRRFYEWAIQPAGKRRLARIQIDEETFNFMLSVVKGLKPKDQLVLAAQMAAIHMATMRLARELAHVDAIPHQDSAERALNKLARTYAMQLEAFKRYRTGGEQTVTVQHVSVSEGGQVIVGNVTQPAGGTAPEKPVTTTPALTDSRQRAMPIIETPAQMLQENGWRAIIRVTPARCLIASAAGRSRAWASPADLQQLPAKRVSDAPWCTGIGRAPR